MDHFVADDGSIRTYSVDEYNIDHILPGRNSPLPLQNHTPGEIPKSRRTPTRTTENAPAHF